MRMLSLNCEDSPIACSHFDIELEAVYPTILWISEGRLQQRFTNFGQLPVADLLDTFRQLLEKIEIRKQLKAGEKDVAKLGKKKKKKRKESGSKKKSSTKMEPTLVLSSDDFDSAVRGAGGGGEEEGKESERIFFVHYTVPWSRHCSRMATDWRRLQGKLAQQDEQLKGAVKLARVDCSLNERLCNDEQVSRLAEML